jgi:hypothetical protein
MIRIVVAGMGKERVAQLLQEAGDGRIEAVVKTDLEAAMAVKAGRAAYYVGACQSGAGGALGVANAILGSASVVRLSGVGTTADPEDVRAAVGAAQPDRRARPRPRRRAARARRVTAGCPTRP